VASNELGHSYVGPEHFLIGLAEEGEGLAANFMAPLRPARCKRCASGKQGGRQGAEDGRAETPTNRRLSWINTRATSPRWRARASSIRSVAAQEIETTIEVLARRKKNNPVLIGEPGVGKTAIVEGCAAHGVAR
jgi:ATP-dependent Clp protease ATP-binding subunit ClpC